MFRFSSKSKDSKKSWIIDFVLGKNKQIKGQIVKVCRHLSGPDQDGSITKQVSDNAVFITAIFTQEAIDNYSFDEDMCTPPEWNQALLIVKDYSLVFLPTQSLENCQFALAIKKFSLLDLNNGIESKNRIYDCMENSLVKKAALEAWTEHNTNKGNTEDSLMLGSQLSILLDAMGSEAVDSQAGSQQPSTSKETAVSQRPSTSKETAGSQRPSTSKETGVKKQSSHELWSYWERLKKRLSVKDWIIPQQQEVMLASIEEWKEDYIPPPSSSRSDSGDAGSSQLQPIPEPSLPGSSGDQVATSGKKSSVPEPSLPGSPRDQVASGKKRSVQEPTIDSRSDRRKVDRRDAKDSKIDTADVESSPRNIPGLLKNGRKIESDHISGSSSPGGNEGKKKNEKKDFRGSRKEIDDIDSPQRHVKPKSPKSKENHPEDSSRHGEGSSGVKEKGERDESVKSCESEEPKTSDSRTQTKFEKEYEKFLQSSQVHTQPEIQIVEVFTLANLPTAWHTSQESIQLSCPSQTDSQEGSQFESSQGSSSKQKEMADLSQSENSQKSNKPDEVVAQSEDPIGDDVPSAENIDVDLQNVQMTHKKDQNIDEGLNKTCERVDEDDECVKDLMAKERIDGKQKSSTPSRGRRKRVTSFFNKSIDASCIGRASTSSRISSVGDEFVSAVLPPDDSPPSPPAKHSVQDLKGSETDRRRVSFAPSAMSTRSSRTRSEALDATDSMVYVDAKSHLSNMESPDVDYPQSQPFVPATQDPLAEYIEEDGIVQNTDLSEERVDFESGKGDSQLDISYHHSTQASAAAPGKPDLSISPIRDSKQAADMSMVDNNSGESPSAEECNGSSVSVVPDTELHDKTPHSKDAGSISKDSGKSHKSENDCGKVHAAKGRSYLKAYCEQHPSFAESGSDEQIPLSGSIYDFPDSSQEGKRNSQKKFEKIPTIRRSSRRKSQPGAYKESESEAEDSKCLSRNSEKNGRNQSGNMAEYDSVEIEEYSTGCSDLEERGNRSSATREKNLSHELKTIIQSEERKDTLPPSGSKSSIGKKSRTKTKQENLGEDSAQFYEKLNKLTYSQKQKETKKDQAKEPEKGPISDNSKLQDLSRGRERKTKETAQDDDDQRSNDNVQNQDNETKDGGFTRRRRQSKAKENKSIENDDEDQRQDVNAAELCPTGSTRRENGKVQEDDTGFSEKNLNRVSDTKKVKTPEPKATTSKGKSKSKGCEKAQEDDDERLNDEDGNKDLVTEDTSSTGLEANVVGLEEDSEEAQKVKSEDRKMEEREVYGCEDNFESDNNFALNTQDAELVVLTALGMDSGTLSELIPVTEFSGSKRKRKNREKTLTLKKKPVLTKDSTDASTTGESTKRKTKSTSPYFDASNNQEETNPEFGNKNLESVKLKSNTSVGKNFITLRRNRARKLSPERETLKESTSVTPKKRKSTKMSEQVEAAGSNCKRTFRDPSPSNIRSTTPDDVIVLDNDRDEIMTNPKPDILKMMDQTLKRLSKKADSRRELKMSSAEKKTTEDRADDIADRPSTDARISLTANESSRISSAEALLTFLNVKPLTGNQVLNHRTKPSLRNKIYQIYQKPIHYPSQQ